MLCRGGVYAHAAPGTKHAGEDSTAAVATTAAAVAAAAATTTVATAIGNAATNGRTAAATAANGHAAAHGHAATIGHAAANAVRDLKELRRTIYVFGTGKSYGGWMENHYFLFFNEKKVFFMSFR